MPFRAVALASGLPTAAAGFGSVNHQWLLPNSVVLEAVVNDKPCSYLGAMKFWGLEVGTITSILGLMVSLMTLWISWSLYKRAKGSDTPHITRAEIRALPFPNWWVARIYLQNRSVLAWTAEDVVIAAPWGAKAKEIDGKGTRWFAKEPDIKECKRRVPIGAAMQPAGSMMLVLIVYVPWSKRLRRRCSFQINLASHDADQRRLARVTNRVTNRKVTVLD